MLRHIQKKRDAAMRVFYQPDHIGTHILLEKKRRCYSLVLKTLHLP